MQQSDIFHQLRQATRIFEKGLSKRLEPYGISPSEWAIIWNLKRNGVMTQASLANLLSIEPPAISNSLSKLEKKKFIRRKSGTDKRERLVFLTEKALTQYEQWDQIADNYRNILVSSLSENQKDELYQLLTVIYTTAQREENEQ
ncbi:MAG: MarR family transcriptional regulator [Negativicutes bacterium]|nr:MarR family transcriptional regulator [Negativicutes bacterium]